ncbi:hypothetical protein MMC07_000436 [Pseudocyphellaria aurata]|nr:hypothetical protein [Pseudocyphellaria aurata]
MNRGKTSKARKIPGAGIINTVLAALVLPIWLLALAAWAVQAASLAAVQAAQGRGHFLQFDWFVTGFELVVLLLMPYHLFARRSTPGIVALKAVVTVLEILRTNAIYAAAVWNDVRLGRAALGQNYIQIDSVTNPGLLAGTTRTNALFSGYLITSFFNLLLIIGLGSLPAYSGQDNEYLSNKAKQGAEHYDEENADGQTKYRTDQHSDFPSANVGSGNTASNTTNTNVVNGGVNGANGATGSSHTTHVPHTHLYETQRDDGLQGPTYLKDGPGRTNV